MEFIKLTQTTSYLSYDREIKQTDPKPIWINVSQITLFGNGYISFGKKGIEVKETPEEILKLIQEAENGNKR